MGNFDSFPRGKSQYFDFRNGYEKDKKLFDLLLTEAINKHGVCMEYYQTSYDTSYDYLFGEDNNRRFIKKFDFMVLYELPREDKMWTKFGIEGLDNFSMYCAKRHFRAASKSPGGGPEVIPRIGDIIMAKYNDYVYEITEVAEEVALFLQSKQHMWEFVVKPYKDEGIELSDSLSATTISAFTNKDEDIFDISNSIDVEKENIIYKPKPEEKGSDDPFANW